MFGNLMDNVAEILKTSDAGLFNQAKEFAKKRLDTNLIGNVTSL